MVDTTTTETGKTLGELAKDILTTTPEPMEDGRNNGELLAEHGLKLMHFRPGHDVPGMTVAYKLINRNVIEIATAITHPNDCFTKKIGARVAIDAFVSGRTAFVPVIYRKKAATYTLKGYFGW